MQERKRSTVMLGVSVIYADLFSTVGKLVLK